MEKLYENYSQMRKILIYNCLIVITQVLELYL